MNVDMVIQTVKAALDKGDQHIMVSPNGSVSMWPDTPTKGWISVNDAKPDKAGTYLVYRGRAATCDWLSANNPDWLVGTGFWNEDGEVWYGSLAKANIDKTVTHWMPMPTAPEGWD